MKKLDVISNNVANAASSGFKEEKVLFEEFLNKDKLSKTSMPVASRSVTNFTAGALQITGRPLDMAIQGNGFFVIQTPQGAQYSRDGAFQINQDGVLVNGNNYPVLSSDNQQIVFEEDDINPIVAENGTVFVGNAERGVVGVVEFDNIHSLQHTGGSMFISNEPAKESENFRVSQGTLETSNVNSISAIAQLAQLEKNVTQTTHMINESINMHRNAYKVYAKVGG